MACVTSHSTRAVVVGAPPWRLDTREARGAVLSVIRRHLHLTSEIEYVREQKRMKKHCGVDFLAAA